MGLNLASGLADSAEMYPNHTAIICGDRRFTFFELENWVAKIAEILVIQGLRVGDRVMLFAPNVPEFTASYYAILRAGGVVVPVNTLLLPHEISALLEHSDSRYFIAWHTFAEKAVKAFETVESCKNLFFIGAKRGELPDAILTHHAVSPLHHPTKFVLDELYNCVSGKIDYTQTSPDNTAVILYTSGTTGKSKGVELTHFNIYSNALYTKEKALCINHESVTIAVLPLFHTFGQTAIQNTSIMAGSTMIMIPQFEPKRTLTDIEKHHVTCIAAVPTMYNLLVQSQRKRHYNVSSLRIALSGGASLPESIFDDFFTHFGIKLIEGYGLSETSPIACVTPAHSKEIKIGSIGPEFFGTQARIMRKDGSFAEVGEIGELVVRGHNVMKGYYKDPAATKAAFTEDWFHTGDIARMDSDKYFYIVDREKDVIIRAGMNIYPREVEEVLHNHPAILEASVIGISDATLSEHVVACITTQHNTEISAIEIQKYCREKLATYKCPKFIEFMPKLPKSSTGKILKRELKELLKDKFK
jgi:long-chain acyl-CoA synthetase